MMSIPTLRNPRLFSGLSTAWFIVLYPGYLAYHFSVGSGVIPPVLGGFFTPCSLVFMLMMSVPFISMVRCSDRTLPVLAPLGLFLGIVAVSAVVGAMFGIPEILNDSMIGASSRLLLLYVSSFILGATVTLGPRLGYGALLCSMIVIAVIVSMNIAENGFQFVYMTGAKGANAAASYQEMARSFLYPAILLVAYSKFLPLKLAITVTALFVLFLIGARSEFVGMLLVLMILGAISRASAKLGILIACGAGVALVVAQGDLISDNRILTLFDLTSDTSTHSRQAMKELGMQAIASDPLFDEYGGHVHWGEGLGTYIHDLFSTWRQYGFVAFAAYVWLMIYGMYVAIRSVARRRTMASEACLYVMSSSVLLALFAKSVFWFMPAFGWGMVYRLLVESDPRVSEDD